MVALFCFWRFGADFNNMEMAMVFPQINKDRLTEEEKKVHCRLSRRGWLVLPKRINYFA
jgi:hypothetical protein